MFGCFGKETSQTAQTGTDLEDVVKRRHFSNVDDLLQYAAVYQEVLPETLVWVKVVLSQ
jgi:hypothetical protein